MEFKFNIFVQDSFDHNKKVVHPLFLLFLAAIACFILTIGFSIIGGLTGFIFSFGAFTLLLTLFWLIKDYG